MILKVVVSWEQEIEESTQMTFCYFCCMNKLIKSCGCKTDESKKQSIQKELGGARAWLGSNFSSVTFSFV